MPSIGVDNSNATPVHLMNGAVDNCHRNTGALNARATRDFHQQKKIDVLTRSALSPDIYGDIFKDDQDCNMSSIA
jgi:hypothetical protein